MKKNENPLAQLREQHGLNNAQLADLLGLKIDNINRLTAQISGHTRKLQDQINDVFSEWREQFPGQNVPSLQACASDLLYKVFTVYGLPPKLQYICRIILRKP